MEICFSRPYSVKSPYDHSTSVNRKLKPICKTTFKNICWFLCIIKLYIIFIVGYTLSSKLCLTVMVNHFMMHKSGKASDVIPVTTYKVFL